VTIEATASDDVGVAEVVFFVNGTPLGTDTTAPYEWLWDSSSVEDGSATLTAKATDAAGNLDTAANVSVTVDNVPVVVPDTSAPSARISAPGDGVTVSGTVTVKATASDNIGVTEVAFLVNGTPVGSDTTAPYEWSWDSKAVADGTATLTVKAVDDAGNIGTSASVSVTVDNVVIEPETTAPEASITAPAAGATVSGSVTIEAIASDNVGVTEVVFFAEGTRLGADTTAPFEWTWDSRSLADGLVNLTVRATDAAGNATTSAPVGVTVANSVTTTPEDIILYAADATRLAGAWRVETQAAAAGGRLIRHPNAGATRLAASASPTHYFELTFQADADVPYHLWLRGRADSNNWANDSVYVQFTNVPSYAIGTTQAAAVTLEDCTSCGLSGWGWQDNAFGTVASPITFAESGPQTIRIQTREDGLAIDQIVLSPARFLTASPGALKNDTTIYPATGAPASDTSKPNVAVTSPVEGNTVKGTVTLTADAFDDVGITRVTFMVNGATVGTAASAPYSTTWNSTSQPDGTVTLSAIASDGAGNVGTSSNVTVTVDNVPDLEADTARPTATLTAPTAGQTVSGTVDLGGNASDNVGVTEVVFLVNGAIVGRASTAPYAAQWDSKSVADGSATVTMRASDAAGNVTTSTPVTVTVANTVSTAPQDIVLHTARAVVSGAWRLEPQASVASGQAVRHPNAGAARLAASATPTHYFELTFQAEANVPYHLWLRGRADSNNWANDSVYVQFTNVTAFPIGTTKAATVTIEDCTSCGLSGWGWQDNEFGALASPITFTTSGPQRIRIQTREDGLAIDQIVLSPARFLTTAPGAVKNDAVIYPEQ
jgi:hypothetical protein